MIFEVRFEETSVLSDEYETQIDCYYPILKKFNLKKDTTVTSYPKYTIEINDLNEMKKLCDESGYIGINCFDYIVFEDATVKDNEERDI